jgi:enoyl-CoA hydratase/carnithine racemase
MERAPLLFIAAIDGYCMGGGLDLALACDWRYATARSVFAHPGARLGLLTGWGGTARLPRTIGRAEALRLFLTAEHISAAEALRLGLIHRVTDGDVLAFACRRVEAAIRSGRRLIACLKDGMWEATRARRGYTWHGLFLGCVSNGEGGKRGDGS